MGVPWHYGSARRAPEQRGPNVREKRGNVERDRVAPAVAAPNSFRPSRAISAISVESVGIRGGESEHHARFRT